MGSEMCIRDSSHRVAKFAGFVNLFISFYSLIIYMNLQMANQIFCFQIKHTPRMAQLMPQFFPDCVIHVCFLFYHFEIFSCILLISNHMVFLMQFGINKHL